MGCSQSGKAITPTPKNVVPSDLQTTRISQSSMAPTSDLQTESKAEPSQTTPASNPQRRRTAEPQKVNIPAAWTAHVSQTADIPFPHQLGLAVKELRPDLEKQCVDVEWESWRDVLRSSDGKIWQQDHTCHENACQHLAKSNVAASEVKHESAGLVKLPRGVHGRSLNGEKIQFGEKDARTQTFSPFHDVKVAFNAKGGLKNRTLRSLRDLLAKGQGICHWRCYVPLLELEVQQQQEGPQGFDWVHKVTLGAEILGEIEAEQDSDEELGGQPVKLMNGQVEQLGGVPIGARQFADQTVEEVLKYLDQEWIPKTRKDPKLWKTVRIDVKTKLSNVEDQIRAAKGRAHIAVFGVTGAGKSSFLNALSGFRKDPLDRAMFETGGGKAELSAITQTIDSQRMAVDRCGKSVCYTLTDMPGFDDPDRDDEETCAQLVEHLHQPHVCCVHALVLVINLNEHRAKEGLLRPIEIMARQFGERMWDHMIIVLTHLDGAMPSQTAGYDGALRWLSDDLPRKRIEWVEKLRSTFGDACEKRWVDRKAICFSIDSEVLRGERDDFNHACKTYTEHVPAADAEPKRVVKPHLLQLIPDSVVKPSEKDKKLQWRNTDKAALFEHSMEQLHQLRASMSQRVSQEQFMSLASGFHDSGALLD